MMRKIIISALGILLGLGILLFAYDRFSGIIDGPLLTDINIQDYEYSDNMSKTIVGTVKNTQHISINGYPIVIKDDSQFRHTIALAPGHTIIRVRLEDSFGSSREYSYTFISAAKAPDYFTTLDEAQQSQVEESPDEELLLPNLN